MPTTEVNTKYLAKTLFALHNRAMGDDVVIYKDSWQIRPRNILPLYFDSSEKQYKGYFLVNLICNLFSNNYDAPVDLIENNCSNYLKILNFAGATEFNEKICFYNKLFYGELSCVSSAHNKLQSIDIDFYLDYLQKKFAFLDKINIKNIFTKIAASKPTEYYYCAQNDIASRTVIDNKYCYIDYIWRHDIALQVQSRFISDIMSQLSKRNYQVFWLNYAQTSAEDSVIESVIKEIGFMLIDQQGYLRHE